MSVRVASSLAESRAAAGYTQEDFAEKLAVDRSTIGRWERGVQAPQPWQRPAIADALKLSLNGLDDVLRRTRQARRHSPNRDARQPTSTPSDPMVVNPDAIHGAVPCLRRALDGIDCPDDGPVRSVDELTVSVARAIDDRVQARYAQLARTLPTLIPELARAGLTGRGSRQRAAAKLLTLAFRAADGLAYKYGYLDLSARLVDLMRSSAQASGDPLLLAAVAYVRTESFFASGDLETAARALVVAIDGVANASVGPLPAVASYGALHMRAAVVAGRSAKAEDAEDHLLEARRAASRVPDGAYYGTAFGPSSVRIHELAVAVELGDRPESVRRAAAWRPPPHLPSERRSHYYIDLARAQLDLGQHQNAYLCLETAREIAPQHTRSHPQVRQSLTTLLQAGDAPIGRVRELAAWARASQPR